MRTLKYILAIVFMVGIVAMPAVVSAQDPCAYATQSTLCSSNNTADPNSVLNTVMNVLFFIVAAVSVIAIIVGGIMYATSAGDAGRTKKAKDTILYAVIGLVVAIFAFAIVNWVVGELT